MTAPPERSYHRWQRRAADQRRQVKEFEPVTVMDQTVMEKPVACPPEWMNLTDRDLPSGDEERMPSQVHVLQMTLSILSLRLHWKDRNDFFLGGDMFVYYSPYQVLTENFKGPDVMVALGVERRVRESWVTWQEGKSPDLVIELHSKSHTEAVRTSKRQVYQNRLRVPEYFWFNHRNGHLKGYELAEGVYRKIEPDRKGRLRSRKLGLLLVRWRGSYAGVEGRWLRWATLEGTLLPTPEEVADAERQRAQEAEQHALQEQQRATAEQQRADEERRQALQERQRAEEQRQRAERLAARLRAMGIDPEET